MQVVRKGNVMKSLKQLKKMFDESVTENKVADERIEKVIKRV